MLKAGFSGGMKALSRRAGMKSLAAFCLAPRLRAQEEALPEERREGIAGIAREVMAEHQIPGLSLAVARHGRLVHKAAFGMADMTTGELCAPDHRFRIASISKPVTSVAVHRLFDRGLLAPEDRVFGRGGRLPQFRAPTPAHEAITLHHLLTHTCGGWGNKKNDPMFQNGGMSHAELIEWTLGGIALENPPGKTYDYSNFGYCLLGRVIEAVTGEAYEAHVRAQVLDPCGVTGMILAGNTRAERAEREVVYHGQRGEDPYRPGMNVRRMDSHGGWLAAAEDLARFLTHVDGFPAPADLLKSGSLKAMTTPWSEGASYARGWSVNSRPNWWHGGSLPGTSTLAVRTASGLCWAVLANTRYRDRENPVKDTAPALDRMMWRIARSVPEWRA
ncbi:MAG TPA: penicillin-binding protein [Verrucomicrobiales bacterium]|nr:penicillin-binding protein [Verrucomicrobiales bacterium]